MTHFVLPATAVDLEAASRGTSVYLVDRRVDMLPKPLTEDICSLRAGVERLAFSVLWEMSAQAETVAVRFTKTVIRSHAALSYGEAQARMDDRWMPTFFFWDFLFFLVAGCKTHHPTHLCRLEEMRP